MSHLFWIGVWVGLCLVALWAIWKSEVIEELDEDYWKWKEWKRRRKDDEE